MDSHKQTPYRQIVKYKTQECPYKKACEQYDETETKAAARRVAKLLVENIESETAYKEAIRDFVETHPKEEEEEKKDETTNN